MNILYAVLCFAVMGLLLGIMLAVASRAFKIKEDPKIGKIRSCLPGANCGCCGFAGCGVAAEKIAKGEAEVNVCAVGGAECAEQIAEIMGVKPKKTVRMRAIVMCMGEGEYVKKKYEYDGEHDCVSAMKLCGGEKLCPNACIGYGSCVSACPQGAISVANDVAKVDYVKCVGCGLCTKACPKGIIKLIPYTAPHYVRCSSTENGLKTKNGCDVGCIGCKICEKNCPVNAIKVIDNHAVIDYNICTDCGTCVTKCPRHIVKNGLKTV